MSTCTHNGPIFSIVALNKHDQYQGKTDLFQTEYFKMVFLEIQVSANMESFRKPNRNCHHPCLYTFNAKQKHLGCKKGEANQKQQSSDDTCD